MSGALKHAEMNVRHMFCNKEGSECVSGAPTHATMKVRHIVCNTGEGVCGLAGGALDAEQEHAGGKAVLFEGCLGLLAVHVGVDKLWGGFIQVTTSPASIGA